MKIRNNLITLTASFLLIATIYADPVPYPDVDSGDSSSKADGKKVDIEDGSSSSSSDSSGSGKSTVSPKRNGKRSSSSGSGDVKVEGKNIPIRPSF